MDERKIRTARPREYGMDEAKIITEKSRECLMFEVKRIRGRPENVGGMN
jgi:hypothetical protein